MVFISSTSKELEEYRTAARDAVLSAGYQPVMMEYRLLSLRRSPDFVLRLHPEAEKLMVRSLL